MHSLLLDSEEMASSLERIMQQTYIEKHIEKPFIDCDKMIFLTDIYRHMNMSFEERKQLLIPVMLVQCALDTHERIPSVNDPEMSDTEKQLSVLAGDYYSGLYYTLLASKGHIDMIRLLATSIREINEYKMRLYYEEANDFNELLFILMQIESSLITRVAKAYQMDHLYIEVAEKVCLINRLTKEVKKAEKHGRTYMTVFLEKSYEEATHVQSVQFIVREIEKQKVELDHLLLRFASSFDGIRETIKQRFALVYHTTFVEEG